VHGNYCSKKLIESCLFVVRNLTKFIFETNRVAGELLDDYILIKKKNSQKKY
jgi:hypothetical protein